MSMFSLVKRNELILENVKLIWSRVHYWKKIKGVPAGDLFQEGVLGMIKALDTYDPEKGLLSVHMYNKIDGAVRNAYRPKKYEDLVSTETVVKDDEAMTLGNLLSAKDETINTEAFIDCKVSILPLMKKILDDREIFVLKCKFGLDGVEQCDLDTIRLVLKHGLGYVCSIQNIKHIERRALLKIRKSLLSSDEKIEVDFREWKNKR